MGFNWTDEITDEAIKLYTDGVSASQVAKHLNQKYKACLTRNSVLGKLHRKGVLERHRPSAPESRSRMTPMARGAAARGEPVVAPRETSKAWRHAPAPTSNVQPKRPKPKPKGAGPVRAFEGALPSAHQCKWPIGDPKHEGFKFCTERALDGFPYCGPHCDKAYQPVASSGTRGGTTELVRALRRYI